MGNQRIKTYRIFQLFTGLSTLEGALVTWLYYSTAVSSDGTFSLPFSSQRFTIMLGLGLATIFWLGLLAASFIWSAKLKSLAAWGQNLLRSGILRIVLAVVVFFAMFVNLLSLCIYFFPVTKWLVPYIKTYALITIIAERIHLLQIWGLLILVQVLAFVFLSRHRETPAAQPLSWLAKASISVWSLSVCTLILSLAWGVVSRDISFQLWIGPTFKLLALSGWFSLWTLAETKNKQHTGRVWQFLIPGTIWLVVFLGSFQLAHWLSQVITPRESYWHLLADSFMHGRVYLPNPPSDQDLVFFNGHWYIPIPPLPAFVMLPFVAILGVGAINTTIISLCLAAATAVLVFLILDEMHSLGWIQLPISGQLWLVAFFAFGTVHLWLSVVSRVWYFSQVCAVFFSALAFLATLKKYPAWVSGLCLGLALLARPNLFTLWPAMLAIAFQLQGAQTPFLNLKKLFTWAISSALPILAAVGLLLSYNYLRFGNLFDFGYTAISSGGSVVNDARQFGIFSLHFLQNDLTSMFLTLPDLNATCNYFLARGHGISMLAASPAILYLLCWPAIRSKTALQPAGEKTQMPTAPIRNVPWWSAGCWVAILLSIGLLATYHNDGSIQYAYRYLIDFIIPVVMLIALNAGKKASLLLKLLILLSVAVNYYGTISWFFSKC